MGNLKTSIVLDLVDRVSGPARRVARSLNRIGLTKSQLSAVGKASGRIGQDMGQVANEAGKLAGKLALLGGAGLWFVKSQLIDTAAEFEKFRTVLETVEGSSAKAQKSMDWVSEFATTTPFELNEVMESFVRLRAYGLDPTNGLLRTLGDTGSAMGKPIMQAVEAIADAVTGENERLKEFGIRAEVSGNRIRYAYTDRAGKQQFKIVDKNNRAMIQSTLEAIWNEKYAGAMEKQSLTWAGMISNLSDQWTRFKVKVMEAGLFDWLKGKLGGLLDTINRMAADGSLQKLANEIGGKIKDGFIAAWNAGKAFMQILQTLGRVVSWLANIMGGYENLAMAVAGLMAGKLLLSVGLLAADFVNLGRVAIPAAATALKGLIPLLSQASLAGGGLLAMLGKGGLVAAAGAAGYGIGTLVNEGIGKAMSWLTDGKHEGSGAIGSWLYDALHKDESQSDALPASKVAPGSSAGDAQSGASKGPGERPLRRPDLAQKSNAKAEVDGTIRLEIEGAPVRVKGMSTSPGLDIDVDSGRNLVGVN